MRAVVKAKPEHGIEIQDLPVPKIKPDEILMKVESVSICGAELKMYKWDKYSESKKMPMPIILGHEGAGIVAEAGENVTRFRPGDRIVVDSWGGCGFCYFCRIGKFNLCEKAKRIGGHADGCMTEYVVIPEHSVYNLPNNISFDEGALIEPFGVSLHAVEKSQIKVGDDVVVMGPGPIGLFAAIAAKAAGAARVIVTGLNIDKVRLEMAAELGFIPVNIDKENVEERVKQLTFIHKGADVVFECAVGRIDRAIPLAKMGGEIVIVGSGDIVPAFDASIIRKKDLTITSQAARQPSTWYRALNLLTSGSISLKQLITHILPLEKAQEGFELLLKREAVKVVLKP